MTDLKICWRWNPRNQQLNRRCVPHELLSKLHRRKLSVNYDSTRVHLNVIKGVDLLIERGPYLFTKPY